MHEIRIEVRTLNSREGDVVAAVVVHNLAKLIKGNLPCHIYGEDGSAGADGPIAGIMLKVDDITARRISELANAETDSTDVKPAG